MRVLFFLLLISTVIFSQPRVEYYTSSGKLEESDHVKKDFGRYDGYELPVQKGEIVHIFVHSGEFEPLVALVNPDGEIYSQGDITGNGYSYINAEIPVFGEWLVYVIGNEKSRGEYTLNLGFTDKASVKFDDKADFCGKLNYLFIHAKAHFIFANEYGNLEKELNFEGMQAKIFDPENISYSIVFYHGNKFARAKNIYDNYSSKVDECLKGWKKVKGEEKHSIIYSKKLDESNVKIAIRLNEIKQGKEFEVCVDVSGK